MFPFWIDFTAMSVAQMMTITAVLVTFISFFTSTARG